MILDRLVKRTSEARTYDIDCSAFLPPGVTIASAVQLAAYPATVPPLAFATATVVASEVVYSDHTAPAGTVIRVKVSGGAAPPPLPHRDYWIRAVFTDSAGDLQEATVPMRIDDTPGSWA
jgi:hypothetical protein